MAQGAGEEQDRTRDSGGRDKPPGAPADQPAEGSRDTQAFHERVLRSVSTSAIVAALTAVIGSVISAAVQVFGEHGPDWVEEVEKIGVDVDLTFYQQTSEVIPVLLLALAIEQRALRIPLGRAAGGRIARLGLVVVALAVVVTAELLSLYALAVDGAEPYFFPVTAGAVIVLLLLAIPVAVVALTQRPVGRTP